LQKLAPERARPHRRFQAPAQEKLDLVRGRWKGSVDPVFAEFAY